MTEHAPIHSSFPEWDLADRMRKSLRHSGMKVGQMAEYLGVAPNTVSTWINGHIEPDRRTLLLWADRTHTTVEWLKTGVSSDPGPGRPRGGGPTPDELAERKRSRTAATPVANSGYPSRTAA